MISTKKKYFSLLTLGLSLIFNTVGSESDDILDIDDIEEEIKEKEIIPEEINNTTILGQILGFRLDNIIKKDFFLRTQTVFKRPVQTLPIFNLYHTDHICQEWFFRISVFGNQTERAFFTDGSPHIKTYFDLEDQNIIDTIKRLPKLDNAQACFDIFKHAKKEERRAGFVMQLLKNFNDFSFEFTLPIFYEERNYFFTLAEREQIEEFFGAKPTKDEEREFRHHALADKFGVGDTRIKLGYLLINKPNIAVKFGLQTTIPTAFEIKKGLLGSDFRKTTKEARPKFEFKQFFKLKEEEELEGKSAEEVRQIKKECQEIKDKLRNNGFRAADWLSAMVLDSPIGNERHFGIGAFIEPQIKINDCVTLKALGYIEYFCPATEKRFFLKQKNQNNFNRDKLKEYSSDDDQSRDTLSFFEDQLIETIFPQIHCCQVTPGYMLQISLGPQFRLREWDFLISYDFWYQHREKIIFIFDNPNDLWVRRSIKPSAFQSKMFLRLAYNKIMPYHDWTLALNYEDSLATKGIGKDFAVAVSFEINF